MKDLRTQPATAAPSGLGRWIRRGVGGSLGWRLVILLTGSLILLLGISGALALELHRRHLYALLEESAIHTGETILSSTYSSMLENDRRHLSQIIQNIGRRSNVTALRLVDAHGEVRYSNRPEEVGDTQDIDAPLCRGCHIGDQVRTPKGLRDGLVVYRQPTGEGTMGLAVPVLNASECSGSGCHPSPDEQHVLGILDLELSTAVLEADLRETRRQIGALALVIAFLIPAVIGLLTWRVAIVPLHRLLDGIRRLGRGDLSHRIPTGYSAEIGELALSFNEMSSRLEKAQADLAAWNERLEAAVAEKTRDLERARDQMIFAEKMASLGKLAAVVAHEINNPLAGILVYARLIRRKLAGLADKEAGPPIGKSLGEMDDNLALIESESARCGEIVRNLLLFSRKREASAEEADLNALLDHTLRLVRHQAELASVDVQFQARPDLSPVICDASEISQALLAIFINAIEAMPDGGTLAVELSTDQGRKEARIKIKDTGVGIPPALQSRIFEPFFSTKRGGKGTGLGLAVAYGIMQRHGGRIDVESSPGAGTSFTLILPRDAGETMRVAATQAAASPPER